MKISNWYFVKWFLVIVVILSSLFLFFKYTNAPEFKQTPGEGVTKYIKVAGTTVKVRLALTPKEQEQGLSGVKSLKDDEGMLFIFSKPAKYSFWMKDMNFPIDIIWINKDLNIVYIKDNAMPESYPETFTPDQDSLYVLEVPSSFSEKNNLKIGEQVQFLP